MQKSTPGNNHMIRRALKSHVSFVVLLLFGTLAVTQPAAASHFRVLYNFAGKPDAFGPLCALRDTQGTLFGISGGGGTNDFGTIFKLTSDGTETVLYSFTKAPPRGNFVMDGSGNFYGATLSSKNDGGTIFKVSPDGTKTVLHTFPEEGFNDASPSGVAMDSKGNLFGATQGGGQFEFGTVFEIAANGEFSTLHSFSDADGIGPSGITLDAAGNLYGTAFQGGAVEVGTLYKITPSGDFTVLHSFDGQHEGYSPDGQVAIDAQGNLFGTLTEGGDFGDGTLFKYDTSGKFSILHEFQGSPKDAAYPWGNLVVESNGKIFGVTQKGGENQKGTVFKLTRRGKFSILHSFDGEYPEACLVSDHMAHLFGTALNGGSLNSGTLFRAQE
jgi:uncharacterized repeat protein (TIGR03803 family)